MVTRRGSDSAPSPSNLDEGRRLVATYARDTGSATSIADAVGAVCGRVINHFGPLIGRSAAQALLTRAVFVSKPWFKALDDVPTAEADADVTPGLLACLRSAEPKEALGAAVSVLGTFVWLLTRFIGEELSLRLLREACPPRDASNLDEESS
jgi:hypothetical protein